MLRDIRAFFDQRGVLEVETPLLSSSASTDPNLKSFATSYQRRDLYLNTSPEFCMKRLLAAYGEPIFQVCKSFRDDELGPLHNPEFTMLEWYRPGFDMFELMDELADLVQVLVRNHQPGATFQRVSYAEVYQQAVGIDPHTTTADECRRCAVEHGLSIPVGMGDSVDEWLDWLLIELVMPSLLTDRYTFIYDYPASQAALAKIHQNRYGHAVAARFELNYGEVELANGFDELLDADEQRRRFEQENEERSSRGLRSSIIDEYLLDALGHGLPRCSGVAMGVDRLLMILSGKSSLEQVLTFPFCKM
jgi:lysyl-tRNA synthetase class 2